MAGAARERGTDRPRPSRPDARPARIVMVAGAIAALTAIGAGLVRYPADAGEQGPPAPAAGSPQATGASSAKGKTRQAKAERRQDRNKRPVRYVRLKPGQVAPKGATVIREAAPPPRIVVRRVAAPVVKVTAKPRTQKSSRRVVTRTRQSG